MLRAAVLTLLAACLLSAPLESQRAGGAFRGHSGGPAIRSRFTGFRFHHHNTSRFLAPYSFWDYGPEYGPLEYEQHYAETATGRAAAPVIIEQRDAEQSPTPAPAKQQIIEITGAANAKSAKTLPATIFILQNGERLESRRFMLTASELFVVIERRERTLPVDMLDIEATIAANRGRGIELRIPAERSEIFLSF